MRADYERDIEFLDAGAGDVGVIAAKDQRIYFALRVRAVGAGGVWTSLYTHIFQK